jgi:hypothetical protein
VAEADDMGGTGGDGRSVDATHMLPSVTVLHQATLAACERPAG